MPTDTQLIKIRAGIEVPLGLKKWAARGWAGRKRDKMGLGSLHVDPPRVLEWELWVAHPAH